MPLILGAMAEQRNRLVFCQKLKEAQGELLAVILDSLIAAVDRPALAQFLAVTRAVFWPGDLSRQEFIPQRLAGPEVRHPNMVTIAWQAAAPSSRRQDPQSILERFDPGVNRLRFDHDYLRAKRGPDGGSAALN